MGQTGRADLLRALAAGAREVQLFVEDDGHGRWAYAPVQPPSSAPAQVQAGTAAEPVQVLPPEPPRPSAAGKRLPLRMPSAWQMEALPARDVAQEARSLPPLTPAELGPLQQFAAPYVDLVPWARVTPRLRSHSDVLAEMGIDWPRLLARTARREVCRRLPYRQVGRWPNTLVLALDFASRLDPYRHDFHQLARRVRSQTAVSGLGIRILPHGPRGPWTTWPAQRRNGASVDTMEHDAVGSWDLYPGATVIVASDLGAYAQDEVADEVRKGWLAWGQRLIRRGVRLIALCPIDPAMLSFEMLNVFHVLRWGLGSTWQRERPVTTAAHGEAATALNHLLALAAPALRVDPPLLRALCKLVAPGAHTALEGRFWNHPDVERLTLSCRVRADKLDTHLTSHATLPQALREAGNMARTADHAHLRRSLHHAEVLRAVSSENEAPAESLAFIKRLVHTLGDQAPELRPAEREEQLRAARLLSESLPERTRAIDPALCACLDAVVAQGVGPHGEQTRLAGFAGQWQWIQQGGGLFLRRVRSLGTGQVMCPPIALADAAAPGWLRGHDGRVLALDWTGDGVQLPPEALSLGDCEVGIGLHRWALQSIRPPIWAEGACVRDGVLFLSHTAPNGKAIEWPAMMDLAKVVSPAGPYLGTDPFGLFADITIPVRERVTLRLRYIPPGQFLMGSLEDVGHDDERPQHPVTLTEGYWLADTPCTQALWQAVMGDNPSQFKEGPDAVERPVERVSYDDVQTFLQRLRKLLPPGCEPTLPTEAQWEYAARAGTSTAYWWGDEVDDTRANWGRKHQSTTPVLQFAPNPWGLHDVHGNVLEWCLDDQLTYAPDPVRDPRGDIEPSQRAVRGGSWFDDPGGARSAYRGGGRRDYRDEDLGFRLSLRSPAPVPGARGPGQGGGTGGPATGAGRLGAAGALPHPKGAVSKKAKAANGRNRK